MNILIDYLASNIGGGQNVAQNQFANLCKNEDIYYYLIVKSRNKMFEKYKSRENIKLIYINYNNLFERIIKQFLLFPKMISDYNIDIIFYPNNYMWYFGKKCKNIVMHQDAAIIKQRLIEIRKKARVKYLILKILSRLSIKYAERNIFVSEYIKGSNNGRVIYNGIKLPDKKGNRDKKYDIAYIVSNLSAHKNIENFIRALSTYKSRYGIELNTRIIGGNEKEQINSYENMIKSYGLKQTIITGRLSHDDVIDELSKAKAYISPSLLESFSIPVFEAIMLGLPVALSDIPIYREFFDGFGLFFNPRDIQDMVVNLYELINNPQKYIISKEIIERRHLTWEEHSKSLLRIFREYE